MVCVHFLTPPEGTVLGFSLQGHAGCGEAGGDIVCAAVSSAAYLTVNTLTDVCRVTPLSLRVGEGEMFFRIEPKDEPLCRGSSSTCKAWRNSTPAPCGWPIWKSKSTCCRKEDESC